MNFVDRKRSFEPVFLWPLLHPLLVLPRVLIQIMSTGSCFWRSLKIKSIRIALLSQKIVDARLNLKLVECPSAKLGDEDLPNPCRSTDTHGMTTHIPTVEVANNANAFCVGSPDRKM